ncbi:MAG: helix-turn-helix domain-containing protein [Longimicrobiales bacterium]
MSDYRRTLTLRARRLREPRCRAGDFRHALQVLGLSQVEAAKVLGISSEFRVSDYCRGAFKVPKAVEQHLRTLLQLGPTDPWPVPQPKRHPTILPPGIE